MKIPSVLRLASYHIQKCVGLDLRRQPQRILQVLEGMRADIVVLQEADKRLPPRPAALPQFMLDEAGWQIVESVDGIALLPGDAQRDAQGNPLEIFMLGSDNAAGINDPADPTTLGRIGNFITRARNFTPAPPALASRHLLDI